MNFKSIGLSAAVATVVAGSALAGAPAQAANLASGGSFIINGTSSISGLNTTDNPTSFTLNLSDFVFTSKTGVFGGSHLTGTPSVASLELTKSGSDFITGAKTAFITGLQFNGADLVFDLDPVTFSGVVRNVNRYFLDADITGVFRTLSDNSAAAGTLSAFKVASNNTKDAGIYLKVPTPALLPGLLGLGIAALRKRKAEATAEASAEA